MFFLFNASQNCKPTQSTFHCVVTTAANLSCTPIKYMRITALCTSNIVHYWGALNIGLHCDSRIDSTSASTLQQIWFQCYKSRMRRTKYTINRWLVFVVVTHIFTSAFDDNDSDTTQTKIVSIINSVSLPPNQSVSSASKSDFLTSSLVIPGQCNYSCSREERMKASTPLQKTGMYGSPEVSYHQTYSTKDWLSILRTPYPTQNLQRKHTTDLHMTIKARKGQLIQV
jgi:hypothetical protein